MKSNQEYASLMNDGLLAAILGLGVVLSGTALLTALPRLGSMGKKVSEAFCRAPWLDAAMTWFIVVPLVAGPLVAGWLGLLAAIVGQLVGLLTWTALHELAHPAVRRGPRIVKVLNRTLGTWRNHAALWVMLPAVPLFRLIRVAQMTVYPALVALVKLPRYRTGEWVNVSRHKFDGLLGHDLIWCLYCDWMTGLWSLGSEMLRNIESLWCPIRFDSQKKCENCRIDFPDVAPASNKQPRKQRSRKQCRRDPRPRRLGRRRHRYRRPPHCWNGNTATPNTAAGSGTPTASPTSPSRADHWTKTKSPATRNDPSGKASVLPFSPRVTTSADAPFRR